MFCGPYLVVFVPLTLVLHSTVDNIPGLYAKNTLIINKKVERDLKLLSHCETQNVAN